MESVDFWSILAFPMSLLLWYVNYPTLRPKQLTISIRSVILCVVTILILAWTMQDGGLLLNSHVRAGNIISAIFLMASATTLAAFMYWCREISRRLL